MDDCECLVCGSKATFKMKDNFEKYYYCDFCGDYSTGDYVSGALTNALYVNFELSDLDKVKCLIFYYLKVKKYHNRSPLIYIDDNDRQDVVGINIKNIMDLYPKNFSEKIDMVMELLATKIKDVGDVFNFSYGDKISLIYFFSCNLYARLSWIDLLNETGYLKKLSSGINEISITFTPKGWEKVDSLQRLNNSKNVFIAMSFNDKDKRIVDAEEGIKQAIKNAKYNPVIIKDKEHNNFIMDEIVYEIKHSHFVITDLTSQNNGAYFEAGFAKGLGKEVFFTCHEDDFENIHFDTKQINMIKWKDKDDLIDKLYKKIKFTIGINE